MKSFALLFIICLCGNFYSQATESMSYQAIVRNQSQELIRNSKIGMRVSILIGSSSGMTVYSETHTPTTNANGIVSVEIGDGLQEKGFFETIDWARGPYFITIETDVLGGTNYTITATNQLLSVPYALFAKNSASLAAGNKENQMMYWNGKNWIAISPGTNNQFLTICNNEITWTDGLCPGQVEAIVCEEITKSRINLRQKIFNDSIIVTIPYVGGDGGYIPAQTIPSTGITGFTAKVQEGVLNSGYGKLTYTISGSTLETGDATFELPIGNKTCTITFAVRTLLNAPKVLPIGSYYNGGLITYIFQPGDIGYINEDIPRYIITEAEDKYWNRFPWGCTGTEINGAKGKHIGTGEQNTWDILKSCKEVGTAADRCDKLELDGFNDWFLPSEEELLTIVNNVGGEKSNWYWSSTQIDGRYSFRIGNILYLAGGRKWESYNTNKVQPLSTRAIRYSPPTGIIDELLCDQVKISNDTVYIRDSADIHIEIPYTGSNGGACPTQTVYSSGVGGLKATIHGEMLSTVGGRVKIHVNGIPDSIGKATFSFTIGNKNCSISFMVNGSRPIGSYYQGGIVAYILKPDDLGYIPNINRYIIVAPDDQSKNAMYGCTNQWVKTNEGVGEGEQNTKNILSTCTNPAIAAELCNSLQLNGYDDWFLPNYSELGKLHNVRNNIVIGLSKTNYWSSSQYSNSEAKVWNFGTWSGWALGFAKSKTSEYYVRAIRYAPSNNGRIDTLFCDKASCDYFVDTTKNQQLIIPYSGGNGGLYSGQTIQSTGVYGLTAFIKSGNFSNGNGNLIYTITGKPNNQGRAYFDIQIGGKKCTVSFLVDTLRIGTPYQGGKIAYIFKPGEIGYIEGETNGIIVATSDNKDLAEWGCNGKIINDANSNVIGRGLQNTINILTLCKTPKIAAEQCDGITINEYDDWFLPSIDELSKLFEHRAIIGGFEQTLYWSSTQVHASMSKAYNFGYSTFNVWENPIKEREKSVKLKVRAIRYFSNESVASLMCEGTSDMTDSIYSKVPITPFHYTVSYKSGNGRRFPVRIFSSIGVKGLQARLEQGVLEAGNGTLRLTISGTPDTSGVANIPILLGGKKCIITLRVDTLRVGTYFQGGRIAYIYRPIDKGYVPNAPSGIIIANADQSERAKFGFNGTLIDIQSLAGFGYGELHTKSIVQSCGTPNIAASLCDTLQLNGFDDWYLPTGDDFYAIGINRSKLGIISNSLYWTSNQENAHYARAWSFVPNQSGWWQTHGKDNEYRVRAIRNFSLDRVQSLNCESASFFGDNIYGKVRVNKPSQITIEYTGGNGISFSERIFLSRGVNGLKATLKSGTLALGNGYLNFLITGLPEKTGIAYFDIAIGGKKCTISMNVDSLRIGTSYQGGKVAYIFNAQDKGFTPNEITGIIVADQDLSQKAMWGCKGVSVQNTDNRIGYGEQNTNAIYNGCDSLPTAASICNSLVMNGYEDWILPSHDDLIKLYFNRVLIGGFGSSIYWSSTQADNFNEFGLNFGVGTLDPKNYAIVKQGKETQSTIRAIRYFNNEYVESIESVSAINGRLQQNVYASNVNFSVNYTKGNGGTYRERAVTSTGVKGLTATLKAGSIMRQQFYSDEYSEGSLQYTISGIPRGSFRDRSGFRLDYDTARFEIYVGDKKIIVSVPVKSESSYLGAVDPSNQGKIAYIFQPGDRFYKAGEFHGIIVANEDIRKKLTDVNIWWNKSLTVTGAWKREIGYGKDNFKKMGYDYGEWFLPSIDELIKISQCKGFEFINDMAYWSSTESSTSDDERKRFAWLLNRGIPRVGEKTSPWWYIFCKYF